MQMARRGVNEDGVVLGIGCAALLLWAAFWIAVIVVAVHFIQKWW